MSAPMDSYHRLTERVAPCMPRAASRTGECRCEVVWEAVCAVAHAWCSLAWVESRRGPLPGRDEIALLISFITTQTQDGLLESLRAFQPMQQATATLVPDAHQTQPQQQTQQTQQQPAQQQQQQHAAPTWAMPWQTGDRAGGRAMAAAVRAPRTPSGAFARFDMPKAPK